MRADRLLAILMLLQTRGSLTAKQLAEELEVSERTIHRDVTALSTAGVPVYTQRGRDGGLRLVEDYTTNLSGLSTDEIRALLMLNVPAPLTELGAAQELKSALLKLAAALPASSREEQLKTRQRIHLDARPWLQHSQQNPHLQTLYHAVWEALWIELDYRGFFDIELHKTVRPYGLVSKANDWYLVWAAEDQIGVIEVGKITEVRLTETRFDFPETFALERFWQSWCATYDENRPRFNARLRLNKALLPVLPERFRNQIEPQVFERQAWADLFLQFVSFEDARMCVLNWGNAVEVLAPDALILSVRDFAQQTLGIYQHSSP